MNIAQLKVKRLQEHLGAIREARHVLYAQRVPLARALRLAGAAAKRVRLSHEKLARVVETAELFAWEPDPRDVVAWHYEQSEALAELEREVRKRIVRIGRTKAANGSSAAARKRREKRAVKLHAQLLRATKRYQIAAGALAQLGLGSYVEEMAEKRQVEPLELWAAQLPKEQREAVRSVTRAIRHLNALEAQKADEL